MRSFNGNIGLINKYTSLTLNKWLLRNDIPSLVKNNFDNGLDKRDSCRILYLAASIRKTKVKSLPSRICDVYRNKDYS